MKQSVFFRRRLLPLVLVFAILISFVPVGTRAEEPLSSVQTVTFDTADDAQKFDLYHSTGGGFAVEDGKLMPTGEAGEFKAIYNVSSEPVRSVSVDMIPNGNDGMYGGLYIAAANAADGQDAIDAYYVGIESHFTGWEDAPNRLDITLGKFQQGWVGEQGSRYVSETGNNNALFTGGNKQPVRICAEIVGNRLIVTVSLVGNPEKQVRTIYTLPGDVELSVGAVGIRSHYNNASYDNFTVEYAPREQLETATVDFEAETDSGKFDLYHSTGGGFAVADGKLTPTGEAGEFKAIYNATSEPVRSVCVDMIPNGNDGMYGGLYIAAANAADGQDAIDAYYVGIESNFTGWEDAPNRLDLTLGKFQQGWIGEQGERVISETGNNNALFTGGNKQPVRICVQLQGNILVATVSLVSDPDKQVSAVYILEEDIDLSAGAVGIRSHYNNAGYDNLTVTAVEAEEPVVPTELVDFENAEQSEKFDFFHSSDGGFAIADGKLTPTGEEGQLKAIYKDENASFSYVSVDIYPGQKGINGGIYLDVTDADHPVDEIEALYVGIESNFPHEGEAAWEDAPNRLDVIVGKFPVWQELHRAVTETGAGNALFTGGVKAPVNLSVGVEGNTLTVTVRLLSNPAKKFTTTYEYAGGQDIALGNVGIRSQFCDAAYDNFAVVYTQVEQDKQPDILPQAPDPTPTETIDFSGADSADQFSFYHSSNGGFAVEDGKLVATGEPGEFKAIYIDENASFSFVKVDIIPGASNDINGGIYIDVTDVDHPVDSITGLYFGLEGNFPHEAEADWEDSGNRMDLIGGSFPAWTELFRLVTETGAGNALFTGGVKAPVTLLVQLEDNQITMTVSLTSDPTCFVQKTYVYEGEGDISLGNVGIRTLDCDASFDNFAVGYTRVEADKEPDYVPEQPLIPTDVVTFEDGDKAKFDFYHSSNGGFVVRDGKLIPIGESGELKAIYKDTNAQFSFVSVDIYPGESGQLDGGIYVDVTAPGHPVDRINALYVGVESNFTGWEDAANRVDMVVGTFPVWQELHRSISETGAGNALFTGGVKQPLNLLVELQGNQLTVTLSLLSDPSQSVTATYAYEGAEDLSLGNVGIRSNFCDASYDNFAVGYTRVEADKDPDTAAPEKEPTDVVDFGAAENEKEFDFYHSSNGGFVIRDGKLVPAGEAGEFKAIYRDGGNTIHSVSVDIYPGESGQINSGIYIGTSTVEHGVDRIKGLAVMIESNFTGWEDAVNRIDVVVGRFPIWRELNRYTSETGNGNALFTGKKEPLRLRVDMDGNELTVTVSLLNDPETFITSVYQYNGATNLSARNVGVRSAFNDASFDRFAVWTTQGGGSADVQPQNSQSSGSQKPAAKPGITPATGDRFCIALPVALMLSCLAAMAGLSWKKKH